MNNQAYSDTASSDAPEEGIKIHIIILYLKKNRFGNTKNNKS